MKLLLLLILLSSVPAIAHEGEDHGASAQTAAPTAGEFLTLAVYPGALEVFLKYPVPHVGEVTTARLYFSDYATNHPVNPISVRVSVLANSRLVVTSQPKKLSDGVYEFGLRFPADTTYAAFAEIAVGSNRLTATLSPLYAGRAAERHLAALRSGTAPDHADDDDFYFPSWLLIPIGLGLAVLLAVLIRRRRSRVRRTPVTTESTVTTINQNTTES